MTSQRLLPAVILCALAGAASATLPPPDDAAKAKAAEAAAKAAWQTKVAAYQQCKVEDRLAAQFGDKGNKAGKNEQGGKADAAAPAQAAAASAPAAAASAPTAAASAPTGTPVASSKPPPCADPGPFAYNPPQQTPLEVSGAHSPAGTAVTPPSVRQESGQIQPSGKKP